MCGFHDNLLQLHGCGKRGKLCQTTKLNGLVHLRHLSRQTSSLVSSCPSHILPPFLFSLESSLFPLCPSQKSPKISIPCTCHSYHCLHPPLLFFFLPLFFLSSLPPPSLLFPFPLPLPFSLPLSSSPPTPLLIPFSSLSLPSSSLPPFSSNLFDQSYKSRSPQGLYILAQCLLVSESL